MIFKIKNISSKDIFIDEPTELFIQGTINFIGLVDMFDVKETRENLEKQVKMLRR